MKNFTVIVVCLLILGYVWREQISEKLHSTILAAPKKPSVACVVEGHPCDDLVVMLNALRPGRYYEESSRLLGLNSSDATNMRRDGGKMVFYMPDGTTLIHNQGVTNLEQGYLTVVFNDKFWLKYDRKGNFVEEGEDYR